jgi:hypothetical protein
MSWSHLPNLPSAASDRPFLIQDGDDLFLINPVGKNIMQFNEANSTFTIMPGKALGVTGEDITALAIDDFVLHGC